MCLIGPDEFQMKRFLVFFAVIFSVSLALPIEYNHKLDESIPIVAIYILIFTGVPGMINYISAHISLSLFLSFFLSYLYGKIRKNQSFQ